MRLKNILRKKAFLFIFTLSLFLSGTTVFGQDKKSVSLSVAPFRLIKEYSYLDIVATSKGKNGFEPCSNLRFVVSQTDTTGVVPDSKLGEVVTNKDGKAKFILPAKFNTTSGSFNVKLENNAIYEDTDETVSVTNVLIQASVEKDGDDFVLNAQLLDNANQPIVEESLNVGLKRLFGNLSLGEEDSYTTDEEGKISVPIDKGLTGVDGKLNFQVTISESDKYGTVIANVYTKFGVPIIDKSSFNERTMWSPPTKTPYFLLIIPNVILIGIWSILTFLLFNLFKIYKSKN